MAKKQRFYKGQIIDGKVVKEVFRVVYEYYISFTDGTHKTYPINS